MFRIALYQRYLMREVFAAVFLVLAAFLALFSFFDLINELRSVGRGGYQLNHALLFVTLSLPGLIYELIPIATLIGSLYALSTLARHSEITVLRASGLATKDLLMTLFRVAGLLALLTLFVGEGLVPFAERTAQELRARALSKVIAQQGFETGLWIKDGRSFINIRKAMPDSSLKGVRIYKFTSANTLESVMEAEDAVFQQPDRWLLSGVVRTVLEADNSWVERRETVEWHSAVNPDLLSVLMVSPERMSLLGLLNYRQHLSENKQQTERYEIAIWKKIIYPLAALVMVALALPFGYSHDRVGGVSLKIFAGVMLGILFYALNGLFSNLGIINAWPPFASATAPSALFMLAAAGMLWWVERR
ncbi:LPS export ABC transporter permease LptG [Dechloromonas sp. TW-R-39-2]|jgi:lipopolysaccharide export system permease protein|uniref:LPS export ABC transporter permease LptG n=1 Tax=Dechloromonas TaxID=73029 RepID=UPI00193D3907|nr:MULTISPECIES: LPS export ABC transporter permease LptG [Dechloromonas]QRM19118.1 LPS export ABC transporter permease LptG [Dechloromonas sp. TW-R-39-2]UCV12550.1 LPS export ABC transporter permease LptG [Dechloromonas denitrificans]